MKPYFIFSLLSFVLFSCKKDSAIESKIANINVSVNIERFDQLFDKSTPADLPQLKANYPFMFSETYKDSFWVAKMQDTLQKQISSQVALKIEDFSEIKSEITLLFQHLKYYFPEFKVPRVITHISQVDYRNKTIVTDSLTFIAIDTYLGSDHEFYKGISKYIRDGFNKEQIVVDLATGYAENYIFQTSKRTLLDEMIYYGKQLYFKDKVIPFKTDAEKIGYSPEQLDWAMANEFEIWQYFIDRALLYSTDSSLPSRFINPAPFSKFQLEQIDNESPGRIGQYIGWQIVKSYMKTNAVSFQDMLLKSSEEIFTNSNFKPRK
ncbi:MAG TPA: gliding motility lipoprotein GldB [Flavobacteriaceae bacterium]|nr:gliding motility lipoprotein GldB [Flavobacteriaceae bacterium]